MEENILIAKKMKGNSMHFKITERRANGYGGKMYERIISSHNSAQMADMFYYLSVIGFPIDEAIQKFKALREEPELFFLK